MTNSQLLRRDDVSALHLRAELKQRLRRGLWAPRMIRRFVEAMLEELLNAGKLSEWSVRHWRGMLRGIEGNTPEYRRVLVRLMQRHRKIAA